MGVLASVRACVRASVRACDYRKHVTRQIADIGEASCVHSMMLQR